MEEGSSNPLKAWYKKDDPPREKDNSSCLNAFKLGIDFFQLQTQSETSALPQSDACQPQIGTTPSDLWVSSLLTHPVILPLVSFHNLVNQFLTINLFYYILPYKIYILLVCFSQFSPVTQLGSTLCNPMECSMPGLPVHHQLPEFTQTHVHWVMLSSHLILCRPLLLLPSIFPSIRVFSNESVLHIRWPKYWSFSFSISPSIGQPGLISFRMDWLDLPAVQGTLKSLLQHHSSKAPILRHSAVSLENCKYTRSSTTWLHIHHVHSYFIDPWHSLILKPLCFMNIQLFIFFKLLY